MKSTKYRSNIVHPLVFVTVKRFDATTCSDDGEDEDPTVMGATMRRDMSGLHEHEFPE
jgi:hypothetical protein